ncbi:MAG: SCP2 sterol-binding domain-containing protein [Sterolibacterium sp.]|jgi:predicted lipid carrier protein YhbT|nr:SCP2 sterol-binding domain-containing protein [Sterolibacterium sp.]MBP9798794.1 SCP2 sterol-binding domain-containing protein [Sterolibacterium sp.]
MKNLPDFTFPQPVARLAARLPQLPPTLLLTTTLNLALDRLLPREPLAPLVGKRLMIRVRDAGLSLRFGMGRRHFHPSFDPRTPDLIITARARDFVALMTREEDADSLFFSRRLLMEGDTELGLLVKNTLDTVELPALDVAQLQQLRPLQVVRKVREVIARAAAMRHPLDVPLA